MVIAGLPYTSLCHVVSVGEGSHWEGPVMWMRWVRHNPFLPFGGGGGVVAVQVGSPKRPSQKLWLCLTSKAVLVFWFYKNIVRGCVWDGSCHKCFGLWWMHSGWATLTRSWMEWGATLALLWWFFAAAWIRLMGQQSQMSCPILFWEKHDVCLVKQV